MFSTTSFISISLNLLKLDGLITNVFSSNLIDVLVELDVEELVDELPLSLLLLLRLSLRQLQLLRSYQLLYHLVKEEMIGLLLQMCLGIRLQSLIAVPVC